MEIYVQVKAVGRRRPVLDKAAYEIPDSASTLREFLTEIVRTEVERYNSKETEARILPFLTNEEIKDQAVVGKVGFGRIYTEKKADLSQAVENALQCFADGLVRVFQNETELEKADDPINLREGDCFTFIRLTFLAGRLW